jgi:hypothetical protein
MDEILLKLRILAKAEMVLFRLHLRRTLRQAALSLVAVLIIILAMGMLNVALYQYLIPRLDSAGSALAVAVIDILVAAAILFAAGRQELGAEYDAAQELRERVVSDLMADADRLRTYVTELHDDIRQIRTTASGFLNPGGINIASILQWLIVLARGFWKR